MIDDASTRPVGDQGQSLVNGQRRRVLFVAYAFPPTGGVSVQRVTKFVKYLPAFGWDCSVLTVENPSVPMFDQSLLDEVPPDTVIRRARTLEPGYATKSIVAASETTASHSLVGKAKNLVRHVARRSSNFVLQPDAQILWRPQALKAGLKLLAEVPHDVIIATGPPFSSFLLASTLARKARLPLALDYRDEWIVMSYWENKQVGVVDRMVQRRLQAGVLRRASLVLATTPATAGELQRLSQSVGGRAQVESIYNGFDLSDFPTDALRAKRKDYGNGTGRFRLSFVGTLWNVTPIGPVVEAILALAEREPGLAEKLELVVVGRRTSQQEAELDRLEGTATRLVRQPFVPHREAIELMCTSDALLLINADLPNTERLINAKAFEYMAARRPIIVVAPKGELWNLLGKLPGTLLARPKEGGEITGVLSTAIERWRDGVVFKSDDWDLASFDRKFLAGKLAGYLTTIAGKQD